MDMASMAREQIYGAIRAFTSATIAEAEAATKAVVRIVDNAEPCDGSCIRCGSVPRGSSGLCNTCLDEDAIRSGEVEQPASDKGVSAMRDAYVALAFAFNRLHGSLRSPDTELCDTFGKARAGIERAFKSSGATL
jgi:hypothetical protein